MKTIDKFSGFHQNLKIKVWEGRSVSFDYIAKVSYGFENFCDEDVIHLIFGFKSLCFLIYAPSDPQLEQIFLNLQRFIRRTQRLFVGKFVLQGADKVISEKVCDGYVSRVFKQVYSDFLIFDDFLSKKYMISKAFELFAEILQLSSNS